MNIALSLRSLLFIVALCVFSGSALLPVYPLYSWHDHQRIAEMFICCIVLGLCFFSRDFLNFPNKNVVFLFFLVGIVSSICAQYIDWALKEWARWFGLFAIVIYVAGMNALPWVQRYIFFIISLVGFFLAFQFLNYYLMAFLTGVKNIDPYFLMYGFDNPRFLAQFQMALLPLLVVFFLQAYDSGKSRRCVAIFVVIVVHWAMVWSMGGRGMIAGVATSMLMLVFINKRFFRLVWVQASFALLGLFLFLFLFKVLPCFLSLEIVGRDVLRYGLSGREAIWLEAVGMMLEHPFLGVGPMHYSAVWNNVAAHPHQLLLLLFSEWGFIAGVLFFGLMGVCFKRSFYFLRGGSASELDGGLWLVLFSAFLLGQVDGVLVMPYGEVWLCVLAGVSLGRWKESGENSRRWFFLFIPFFLLAFFILLRVVFFEAPNYIESEALFIKQHAIGSPPRFWGQGWIPM